MGRHQRQDSFAQLLVTATGLVDERFGLLQVIEFQSIPKHFFDGCVELGHCSSQGIQVR